MANGTRTLVARLMLASIAACAGTALAAVYKCVDPATGKVTYSDGRCPEEGGEKLDLPDSAVANGRPASKSEPRRRIIRPRPDTPPRPAAARGDDRLPSADEIAMGLAWYRTRARELEDGAFTPAKARRLADAAVISQSAEAVDDAIRVLARHRMREDRAYDELVGCRTKLEGGHACK